MTVSSLADATRSITSGGFLINGGEGYDEEDSFGRIKLK
jgi:hypothetical protein